MTKKRIATMATCIALVGAVAVGGTLALLTSPSDKVTNTFTIGEGYEDQDFYIDENAVKRDYSTGNYGGYIEDTNKGRGDAIDFKDVVAGTTLSKDPTLHIKSDAPASWVVAKITGLTENSGKLSLEGTISGWYKLEDGELKEVTSAADLKDDTLYVYGTKLVADNLDTTPIFETVRVASNVAKGTTFTNIEVTGVAVEALEGSEFNVDNMTAVLAAADEII